MKWSEILPQEALDLSSQLEVWAMKERRAGYGVCPEQDQIFRALSLTTPDKLKVCLVGQDPYHTPGQANGLAFSIAPGNPLQPSLQNIFKELSNDIGCGTPPNGDLTAWAEHGVLLLNTTLTVREHQPNSHSNWGWDKFTKAVLQEAYKLPQPIVFILWGRNAQDLRKDLIRAGDQKVSNGVIVNNVYRKGFVMSSHPSPFSVGRPCGDTPPFRGSHPFSATNAILENLGGLPVNWDLT